LPTVWKLLDSSGTTTQRAYAIEEHCREKRGKARRGDADEYKARGSVHFARDPGLAFKLSRPHWA